MKNEKNLSKRKPVYFTDNRIYGCFSLIVLLLNVIAAVLLRCIISNSSDVVPSAIIGLLSGLLASVVAAWLLDLATCRRKNNTLKNAVDSDLSDLKLWLNELFQEMRESLHSQDSQNGYKIETLFHLFVERHKTSTNTAVLEKDSVGIYVYTNLIISTIDKLTTGEEKEYLLAEYDDTSPFLILTKSISDFRENLFNNGNLNYDYIFSGIYDFLSTVIHYADLLSKEYNVTLTHHKKE